MNRHRLPGGSRARVLAGLGVLAVVAAGLPALDRAVGPDGAAAAAALPLLAATDASWLDREHVRASLLRGARDCDTPFRYSSVASSRMLSGTLLGADLAPVVALSGVTTTHSGLAGTTTTAQPATAPLTGPETHSAPLSATALSTLGTQVTSVVALPTAGQELGVLRQAARAAGDGEAGAATGAVTETGAVRTTSGTGSVPDGTLPASAVIDLAKLAPATATLAGAGLRVGAVASTAMLDGCLRDESGAPVVRDYGIADLRLVAATPAVPAVVSTAKTAAATAQASVTTLEQTLASALSVGGLLGATTRVTVDVNTTTAISGLLSQRLGEGSEVVVDLTSGTVEVDLARLLGGVNGRAANTQLVLDQAALDLVALRVTELLDAWVTSLTTALDAALRAAAVTVRATLLGATVLSIDTTVAALLGGTATIGLLGLGVDGGAVLGTLVTGLTAGLFGPTGVVATLGSTVRAAIAPVTAAASTVLSGLRSVVSLVVNHQTEGGGAYDVAALRIGVVAGGATPLTALRLATSSVGPVLARP